MWKAVVSLQRSRLFRKAILLVMISALTWTALVVADEPESAPEDHYRVLEWKDLVPEGWEPPIVSAAFDEMTTDDIDEKALVPDLHDQLVAIPGYMKPVVFEGNEVSEFLLVPYLPHQVTGHAHLDLNQVVYVYAYEPVQVDNPFDPIWVVGAMALDPVMTDEGPAGYRINDAVTTEYETR